MQDFFGE
jgi:hypothetical protein